MDCDKFFENMRELVYLSDLDSDELVWINKATRRYLKLKPASKIANIKCYQILHDDPFSNPGYTRYELKRDSFYEWTYYDTVTRRYYNRKATVLEYKGRDVRFEIAIDISDQNAELDLVNELNANEKLINSAMIEAMSVDDPEKSIVNLLSYIGPRFECERVYFLEKNSDDLFDATYEWVTKNAKSLKQVRHNLDIDTLEHLWQAFLNHENLIIRDVSSLKKDSPDLYKFFRQHKVDRLIAGPVCLNREILGFLGADNPPAYKLENISVILQVLAHFLALLLRQRNNVNRLADYSFHDHMTGVSNRHALNAKLKKLKRCSGIGLIMADLNGLKGVNDHEGHEAGDRLIMDMAEALKKIYKIDEIFRFGGDEFIIMRECSSVDEIKTEAHKVRKSLITQGIASAVGYAWTAKGADDFEDLLRKADEKMYQDKRRFYEYQSAAFVDFD